MVFNQITINQYMSVERNSYIKMHDNFYDCFKSVARYPDVVVEDPLGSILEKNEIIYVDYIDSVYHVFSSASRSPLDSKFLLYSTLDIGSAKQAAMDIAEMFEFDSDNIHFSSSTLLGIV